MAKLFQEEEEKKGKEMKGEERDLTFSLFLDDHFWPWLLILHPPFPPLRQTHPATPHIPLLPLPHPCHALLVRVN